MTPSQIQKFKEALKVASDSLTKEDFAAAFQKVLAFVKQIKDKNDQEWTLIKSGIAMLGDSLQAKTDTEMQEAIAELNAKIAVALKEQEAGMKSIIDKLAMLKSGEDGEDGKDADEQAIIAEVLKQIPPDVEETPEQTRDKLESLIGTQRLRANAIDGLEDVITKNLPKAAGRVGWGAHPLLIQNSSGTAVDKVARIIKFGTNLTATRSADGVVTVTASGGSSSYEVPTGTVNGTNKVFVFSAAPSAIAVDGVVMRKTAGDGTANWSGAGATITLTVAPTFDIFRLS